MLAYSCPGQLDRDIHDHLQVPRRAGGASPLQGTEHLFAGGLGLAAFAGFLFKVSGLVVAVEACE